MHNDDQPSIGDEIADMIVWASIGAIGALILFYTYYLRVSQ